MKLVILATFISAAGAGGYYALHLRVKARERAEIAAAWQQFDTAARKLSEADMRTALDGVLALAPTDALAASRRQALETGNADPTDPAMVYLTLRLNLRANRSAEALGEAKKRLAHEPKDWLARCVLVRAALARGDRDAANRELDALPSPDHPQAGGDISGLLYAIQLYRTVGRDTAPLRTFLQNSVLPWLRSGSARRLSPSGKVGLVNCYLAAFEPDTEKLQPPAVVAAWSPTARLADLALDEAIESSDTHALAQVGRLGPRLSTALQLLRQHEQINAEQFADLNRELQTRTRRAWQTIHEREPKNAEAYAALARSHLRAGEYAQGRKLTIQGLAACGDDPSLAMLFSRMLQLEGRSLEAYRALVGTARKNAGQAVWWALAAEAAIVAHRPELALQACQRVREIEPGNRWADRTEARLLLGAGEPDKAAKLLLKLDPARLARDPDAAYLYVRAMTESGQSERVVKLLDQTVEVSDQADNSEVAVAALRGWTEAPPDRSRAAKIRERVDRLLVRWPDDADLYRLRADALFQLAALADPPWDVVPARAATQAYERLRARRPNDLAAATGLGWLRLYGDDDPQQALYDIAPLRAVEAKLSPDQLELLGMVYRRNEMFDDAVRVLRRAAQSPGAPAGCFTQLALTYQARGQRDEAGAALQVARDRPRSAREQADYVAAVHTILNNR